MNRRVFIFMILVSVTLVASIGGLVHRQYRLRAQVRENYFLALYYIALDVTQQEGGGKDRSQSMEQLLRSYGGDNSVLLEVLEDGVSFRLTDNGFVLEENGAHSVGLFQSDRLIAREGEWPHWHKSGKKAAKK